jgi:hypothetical protein
MQITHYLASENSPIHISHFDPRGLQCVHLLCTNGEQAKHVKTFHCNCEFVLPRVPLSVSFTQKGVHALSRYSTNFWMSKKGESCICSGDTLPEKSNTIPLQNQYMDLESNEYHNTCKGKVSKCTWRAHTSSYCTLIYTEFLRTIRIHAGKCHTQSQT